MKLLTGKEVDRRIREKSNGRIWMKNPDDYRGMKVKQLFVDNSCGENIEFICTVSNVYYQNSGAGIYRNNKISASRLRIGRDVDKYIRTQSQNKLWMQDPNDYRGANAKQIFIDNSFGEYIEFKSTPSKVGLGAGAKLYHGKKISMTKIKYTNKYLLKLAKQYKTRSAFMFDHINAYSCLQRRGLLIEAFKHMERSGSSKQRYIYAIINKQKRSAYIGLSYDPQHRFLAHKHHGKASVKTLIYSKATLKILTGPLDNQEAVKREGYFKNKYIEMGWNVLNKAPVGSLGAMKRFWTKDKIIYVANKCSTRTEFNKKYGGAYRAAKILNILNEVCSHMPKDVSKTKSWRKCAGMALGTRPFWSIDVESRKRRLWLNQRLCAEELGIRDGGVWVGLNRCVRIISTLPSISPKHRYIFKIK